VLLTGVIAGATGSLLEHRHLVKRVRFPVEVIPAAPAITHSLPHLALLGLTAILCFAGGHGGVAAVTLPYFYVCGVLLALGLGLCLAATAVVVRDVSRALPSLLQVWFWVTPIAWATTRLPHVGRELLVINPAAYVVTGYRHALMPRAFPAPTLAQSGAFWLIALALLVAGAWCFARLRPHLWECL
jgi:ABC-type polysaccharide/polyol phosphate export permease